MATAEELIKGAQDKMVKSVEHARSGFATVQSAMPVPWDDEPMSFASSPKSLILPKLRLGTPAEDGFR